MNGLVICPHCGARHEADRQAADSTRCSCGAEMSPPNEPSPPDPATEGPGAAADGAEAERPPWWRRRNVLVWQVVPALAFGLCGGLSVVGLGGDTGDLRVAQFVWLLCVAIGAAIGSAVVSAVQAWSLSALCVALPFLGMLTGFVAPARLFLPGVPFLLCLILAPPLLAGFGFVVGMLIEATGRRRRVAAIVLATGMLAAAVAVGAAAFLPQVHVPVAVGWLRNGRNPDHALRVLGTIRSPRAIGPLTRLAQGGDDRGVDMAIRALARIGTLESTEAIAATASRGAPYLDMDLCNALAKLGDVRAVPGLLALCLESGDADVRNAAGKALKQIGAPAVEFALSQLGSDDERQRRRAALALGALGAARAIPQLTTALSDDSAGVRSAACWALADLRDPRDAPSLVKALTGEQFAARWVAARSLAARGDPRGLDVLVAGLEHDDALIVYGSVESLAQLGGPTATRLLVKMAASNGHAKRREARTALAGMGQAAVPSLIDALDDADTAVRVAVLDPLAAMGDRRAVEPIISLLSDPAAELREAALAALKTMHARAEEPLLDLLMGDDDSLRQWASRKLAEWELVNPATTEGLLSAMRHPNPSVRLVATRMLATGNHGNYREALIAAQKGDTTANPTQDEIDKYDRSDEVRAATLGALEDSSEEVRIAAVEALAGWGHYSMEDHLLRALKDRSPRVREAAAKVIAGLPYGMRYHVDEKSKLGKALDEYNRQRLEGARSLMGH